MCPISAVWLSPHSKHRTCKVPPCTARSDPFCCRSVSLKSCLFSVFILFFLPFGNAPAFTFDDLVPSGHSIPCSPDYKISKDGYNESADCEVNNKEYNLHCDLGKINVRRITPASVHKPELKNLVTITEETTHILSCMKYTGLTVYQDRISQSIVSDDRFEGTDKGGMLKVGLQCSRVGIDVKTGQDKSAPEIQYDFLFDSSAKSAWNACKDHVVEWQVQPQGGSRDGYAPASATDFSGNQWPSGAVKYVNGQYQGDIEVRFKPDTEFEKNKHFLVMLDKVRWRKGNVTLPERGSKFTNPTLASRIINDDGGYPVFEMALANPDVREGDAGNTTATLVIHRTGNIEDRVGLVVRWEFGNGPDSADAEDVGKLNMLIAFNSGESSKEIPIDIKGDKVREGDEIVYIKGLSDFSGSTWVNEHNRLKVTIKDNELQPVNGWGIYSNMESDRISETRRYDPDYRTIIDLLIKNTEPFETSDDPMGFGIGIDGLTESDIRGISVSGEFIKGAPYGEVGHKIISSSNNRITIMVSNNEYGYVANKYNVKIRLADDREYEPDGKVTVNLVRTPGFTGVINQPTVSFSFVDNDPGWAIPAGNMSIKEDGN